MIFELCEKPLICILLWELGQHPVEERWPWGYPSLYQLAQTRIGTVRRVYEQWGRKSYNIEKSKIKCVTRGASLCSPIVPYLVLELAWLLNKDTNSFWLMHTIETYLSGPYCKLVQERIAYFWWRRIKMMREDFEMSCQHGHTCQLNPFQTPRGAVFLALLLPVFRIFKPRF